MSQNYTPEFKRRLSASMRKKDEPTKASPLSMAYPKPASPSGAANSAKNARQSPSQHEGEPPAEGVRKEFLKKAAAFFAKEID